MTAIKHCNSRADAYRGNKGRAVADDEAEHSRQSPRQDGPVLRTCETFRGQDKGCNASRFECCQFRLTMPNRLVLCDDDPSSLADRT